MDSIKCKSCKLINFSTDETCRRCGELLYQAAKNKSGNEPMSFSLPFGKIAVIVIVAIVGYYIYSSMPASKTATNTNNAASQSAAPVGLSRTQYDQQRAGNFTNNIKDSPSLQAQKKHDEETKKLMQQASNSSQ